MSGASAPLARLVRLSCAVKVISKGRWLSDVHVQAQTFVITFLVGNKPYVQTCMQDLLLMQQERSRQITEHEDIDQPLQLSLSHCVEHANLCPHRIMLL